MRDVKRGGSMRGSAMYASKSSSMKRLALVSNDNYGVPWPSTYEPDVTGYTIIRTSETNIVDPSSVRVLGVRIDEFPESITSRTDPLCLRVAVTLMNAGGSKNGGIIGGCSVFYAPKRVKGRWGVTCEGMEDG